MPFNLDNFKNQPPIAVINDKDICGLSIFKNRLEQLFFSDVVIRNRNYASKSAKLIIEVSCNFSLWEGMSHLKSGIWAQFQKPSSKTLVSSEFYDLVIKLQEQNSFAIDIEEFSIIFNNCNIIINQIYDCSIPQQLDCILSKLADHYTSMTKGIREVPYEIFIPVFEEEAKVEEIPLSLVPNIATNIRGIIDYFNFWGLYFGSADDALIYNLKKKDIIKGELNMLND